MEPMSSLAGPGTDTVSYSARTNSVKVTIDGKANDGEKTELDNVHGDVECIKRRRRRRQARRLGG